MKPYLAASGHNLYMKCMHVYLQQVHNLHETHPEVSRHFDQGLHVVRRSDRYQEELYTKDSAHERHTGGRADPTVDFTWDIVMKSKKRRPLIHRGQQAAIH